MKPHDNNNDLKGLCFTIITLVSGVLTYVGTWTYHGTEHCSIWARLAGIPAILATWVGQPKPENGYAVAVVGSLCIYFVIGTALLLVIQHRIEKHREKKKTKPNDI